MYVHWALGVFVRWNVGLSYKYVSTLLGVLIPQHVYKHSAHITSTSQVVHMRHTRVIDILYNVLVYRYGHTWAWALMVDMCTRKMYVGMFNAKCSSMCTCMYVIIHVYISLSIYIYIHNVLDVIICISLSLSLSIYIYIYIYTCCIRFGTHTFQFKSNRSYLVCPENAQTDTCTCARLPIPRARGASSSS